LNVFVSKPSHYGWGTFLYDLPAQGLQWITLDLQHLQAAVKPEQRRQLCQIIVDYAEVIERSQEVNERDR